jgi:hypothetical protein
MDTITSPRRIPIAVLLFHSLPSNHEIIINLLSVSFYENGNKLIMFLCYHE